jgi:diguanylate cyclase (GGDEF)-like protein
VLVALWLALRRPIDARLVEALANVDGRLAEIDQRITAAVRPRGGDEPELGPPITATLELPEVLQRTLAATRAIKEVDGGRVHVRQPDGTITSEASGRVVTSVKQDGIEGPPDATPFAWGRASWEGFGTDALRSGLVVPLGEGSLSVYSRTPNAFDDDAVELLTAIARRAEPAVQNAFRYLEAQHLAATDSRTGLGSASAFEEALPRELSTARRHGRPLCLIQVDLDNFGAINKRAGGSLEDGNAALAEFGERVRQLIRLSDTAFRNSGGADEFFLILPETTREEAKLFYARLEFEMATPPLAGLNPPVTLSSGLAELRASDTEASIRNRAGVAQRLAKSYGKNQLVADDDPRMPPE